MPNFIEIEETLFVDGRTPYGRTFATYCIRSKLKSRPKNTPLIKFFGSIK